MSGRGRGRGRKPAISREIENENEDNVDSVKPTKRVSKKKQFPIVAVITSDGIDGNLQPVSRKPLIAHLPINVDNISFNDTPIKYNPNPPETVEAYDSSIDNPFADTNELIIHDIQIEQTDKVISEPVSTRAAQGVAVESFDIDKYKNITLMVQYNESSDVKELPSSTTIACLWCCHGFEGRPVVLPVRDEGEHLQVYGNFCSPECAMSHLFDMRQDSHTRWEQLALLNRIYAESVGGIIRPAPPRSVLKLFGGPVTIEEYRNIVRKGIARIDVHLPPMISLLSTMDTKPIDFYDASLTKNVMETVKERLQKAEEVLKLRRTKPLKAWESTLDACMNLRVRSTEKAFTSEVLVGGSSE
jgi:hypothetical protein